MDIVSQSKAVILIGRLFDMSTPTVPVLRTSPQKPRFESRALRQPLARATPESTGVSSEHLRAFFAELDADRRIDMHAVMVLKDGKVIAEGDFGAYRLDTWHSTYSLCKSIVGLATGILVGDGVLSTDERVADILKKRTRRLDLSMMKGVTVEHLLTMGTGALFNEASSMTEPDWVRGFLASARRFEAGKGFAYNSLNTYMLGAVIREKTGKSLTDFLNERLFGPMGIEQFFWETCPKGIEKGGWGLYIRLEDAAKLGQLVMNGGEWEGRQLVPRDWVERASHTRVKAADDRGGYDYGYQMWTRDKSDEFLFNGMFGQNIVGFRNTGILVACNAGNNEFFQLSDYFKLLDKYFGPDYRPAEKSLRPAPLALFRLRRLERRLGHSAYGGPYKKGCAALDGTVYTFDVQETAAVGLMPLMLQAVQNNYTKGISEVGFRLCGGDFYADITEGGATRALRIGFHAPVYNDLDFAGEPYRVGAQGRFSRDEDGNEVLVLRFSFIETAHSRVIKIFFTSGDTARFVFSERPGRAYLELAYASTANELKNLPLLEPLLARTESGFIEYKIRRAFEPQATGHGTKKGKE